jgi:hypothetical protein
VQITFNFQARDVPCDRCGWLDGLGGIEVEDVTRNRRVFCHQCVIDLVRVCLPNGRFGSYDTQSAPVPVSPLVVQQVA